jgi:ectoine hydroxylase-related dioxygenase (phytanoyl-CoA dioxygenase family)
VLPQTLETCVTSISLQAGEAIFYSDRLFHGSYANNADHDRVVVTGRIVEADAKLLYFHKKSGDEVDVYLADETFYLSQIDSLAKGKPPSGVARCYSRAYRHEPVTEQRLESCIAGSFVTGQQPAVRCRLFRDEALQDAFERDGYALIDLIGPEQVEDILAFYRGLDHAPMPQHGFQVSLDNQGSEFVKAVTAKLTETVKPFVDDRFQDHRLFTASFVVKEKNPQGVVPPHQDWTFVDERKYWSATIWCSLVDTDIHNGALGVIPGSHRFYDHARPSPSPQYEPPFKRQLFTIFPYLKIVDMKAGQALVFDNRTLHASLPNTVDQTRVAFGLGITHRDATLKHFYLLPKQEREMVQEYEVQPEFFMTYNNARLSEMHANGDQPRDLNSTGLFKYNCKRYDDRQLQNIIEAAGNVRNLPLIQTMAALFGYNEDGTKRQGSGDSRRDGGGPLPSFWRIYTPTNIYREIQYRLSRQNGESGWTSYTPARVLAEIKHRLAKRRAA